MTGLTSSSSPVSPPNKPPHDRDRRLAARLRYARFPYRRTIDEFDFEFQPTVDRKLIEDLATLRFIDENRPILFLGQPGCGKTHLAIALATARGRSRLPRLLHHRRSHVRHAHPRRTRREPSHEAQDLHRAHRAW